jgi:tetratricopeptide (TPR) repeat protein
MLLSAFALILVLAQDSAPQPAPNNVAADLPAAIQLSQEGHDAAALAALQKIAAANPNDQLARLWIARVYDRMGHPELAEPVYYSIVLEDPRSVDAQMGVGVTLLEQDQIDAAIDALERAEQLAPENTNVLAALADAHRRAGHTERSLAYSQHVIALQPTQEHRLALEQVRQERENRFESQTLDENYNGTTPDTRGEEFAVNFRLSEAWRVEGRGQIQTKFGLREERAGGGAQFRLNGAATLSGQVLLGRSNDPDHQAKVLPQGDYFGRIDYAYHRATWTGTVRYYDFFGSNVTMVSPGVSIAPSSDWTFGLLYALTKTTTFTTTGIRGNTLQLRAAHEIKPRIWLRGMYSRGVENFDNFSSDRIGDFHANTGTAAIEVRFKTLTSLVGNYDYQKRQDGITMSRFNVALVQSF